MKEVFFEQLRIELKKNNLDDAKIESIISDYEKTFELGKDAGLSDNEVIAKLGNPRSIASEYSGHQRMDYDEKEFSDNPKKVILEPKELYNISFDLIAGEVNVNFHDGEKIVVVPDEVNDDNWEAILQNNCFRLRNNKKVSFFFRDKRKGNFNIFLPKYIKIKEVNVADINSKITIESLEAEKIKLSTINGTLKCPIVKGNQVDLKSVNGRMEVELADGGRVNVKSVNAKIEVGKILGKRVDVSNVSGIIRIGEVDKDVLKTSNVVGKMSINEKA